MPVGRLPENDSAGVGEPELVTEKVNGSPSTAVALSALPMLAPAFTVRVNAWVAGCRCRWSR